MATDYSETILDTIEAFLEGAPALEEDNVQTIIFHQSLPPTIEFATVFDGVTRFIEIDGRHYKVTVMAQEG